MTDKNIDSYTIAFYNIENLFDTVDDPRTNDDDFLPFSKKRWTKKRYTNKLIKIGNVISEIGDDSSSYAPIIVGLAEIENKTVLSDLVNIKTLKDEEYSFVHFDSSDERGIDVALLYKSEIFKVYNSDSFSVYFEDELGQRDYTRDILLVQGKLENENISILVNHWSSRREGEEETKHKRLAAAHKVNAIIENIHLTNPDEKIIVMGDFNDNPDDDSIRLIETESQLFNPFKTIWSRDKGSLNHNFQWNLFDQILCSTNFLNSADSPISFKTADIFNNKFLTQYHGKYKGQPFRTYVGKRYKGGYSDHFPVYLSLKKG
ncbi:endonuclease [Winogradskyella sp. DF17]|uniref:Endonuclease n=1 Tax=Winogradskyella pelagia TaxID=2819984 RepID=A0ABS3SXY8_9FLAO|nr:endonuclease/exonuclease/phosphatase family protein [Winogradskyella sp. DF17]MBO3115353.1 endonuclease [Winogradskyella sp. DF17]